jgi:hypothetical protein
LRPAPIGSGDVQVARRGAQVPVAQPLADAVQVDTGFQQMLSTSSENSPKVSK